MKTYERILERLPKILERLSMKAASGVPIIVEGKKDASALTRLGITGEFIKVKEGGKVLEDRLGTIRCREAVILVDFDEHGTEIAKEISRILESYDCRPDLTIWRDLRALVRKDIKDVEGLPSYLESLKKKMEG
jgi:5S rRNA maturation endonuclease (ribonuclease M5)